MHGYTQAVVESLGYRALTRQSKIHYLYLIQLDMLVII
jgi:hypothetical protein